MLLANILRHMYYFLSIFFNALHLFAVGVVFLWCCCSSTGQNHSALLLFRFTCSPFRHEWHFNHHRRVPIMSWEHCSLSFTFLFVFDLSSEKKRPKKLNLQIYMRETSERAAAAAAAAAEKEIKHRILDITWILEITRLDTNTLHDVEITALFITKGGTETERNAVIHILKSYTYKTRDLLPFSGFLFSILPQWECVFRWQSCHPHRIYIYNCMRRSHFVIIVVPIHICSRTFVNENRQRRRCRCWRWRWQWWRGVK